MKISINPAITYTATGMQTEFDFPFDYLRKAFVCVQVNGETVTNYTIDGKTIRFTEAPALSSVVAIFRDTTTQRLVSWADASVLKSGDMTLQQLQLLHTLEEAQYWITSHALMLDMEVSGINPTLPWGKDQTFTWNEDGTAIILTDNPAKILPIVTQKVTDLENYVVEKMQEINDLVASLNSMTREELQALRDECATYAENAEAAALINTRWLLGEPRTRASWKPDYGLSGADLLITVPDVVNLNVID